MASVVLIKGTAATTDTNSASGTATAVEELVDLLLADTTAETEAVVVQSLFLPVVRR